MRKIIGILFILFFVQPSFAQTKIYDFKKVADTAVSLNFNKSLSSNIKCKSISFITQYGIRGWYPNGEPDINDTTNFKMATFLYAIEIPSLKGVLEFNVSVSRDSFLNVNFLDFKKIPDCILNNTECNFITRDSAIEIAIANSILYPNNLSSVLKFSRKRNKYYWYVQGNDKEKAKTKTTAKAIGIRERLIVDPVNGDVFSYDQF